MDSIFEVMGSSWRRWPFVQWANLVGSLSTEFSLRQQVCVPLWMLGLTIAVALGLSLGTWVAVRRSQNLNSMLEQLSEDSTSLAELFGSELERLRGQLSQSKEDSESLDEILGSILQGGLPGQLEMVSKDYWCVKTMHVSYMDHEGISRKWSQSGYHVNCFVPGGARDIEVTFGVVGGAEVKQVDRSDTDCPYVLDDKGRTQTEKFVYARCPCSVKFEIRGPSLGAFISAVTEVDDRARGRALKAPRDSGRQCT